MSPAPSDSVKPGKPGLTEPSEYQRMVTKDRTPTARPWPELIYDTDLDPTLEADDGSWPPLAAYREWWEIPGIARFENEADAAFAVAAVNSIAPIKAALTEAVKVLCAAQGDACYDRKDEAIQNIAHAIDILTRLRP